MYPRACDFSSGSSYIFTPSSLETVFGENLLELSIERDFWEVVTVKDSSVFFFIDFLSVLPTTPFVKELAGY